MVVDQKETYTLLTLEERSFLDFYNKLTDYEKKHKKEHLIIHVSKNINISDQEFLLLLEMASQKKENGTSFVMIQRDFNVDDFPDNFNIVPTLTEAIDILEMEAIERELGF